MSSAHDAHLAAHQEKERRLELLIRSIRDYAIFMLDPEGRIMTWNLGAEAIKGYKPDEIIGKHLETFYTPEDRAIKHAQKLLEVAKRDGRVEEEGWRVRKDGTRFFADVVITALRDPDGTLVGFAKITRDLTDKRRLEEQRFESEQRFRLLVDSVRDYAIFMLDKTGHVATWNPAAERIKGYPPDEIIGKHLSVFYPPEVAATGHPERELATAVEQGRFEEESWRVRKDGSRFWASVVLAPIYNRQREHIGFVKVTRDLTERRQADEERMRLGQAQEAIRLRDDFLSIASHELRTPLMSLQLQVESLQRQLGTNDKLKTKLERADRSVRRLAELVETLLDVTRITTGKLTLRSREVDLGDVVRDSVDRLQEAANQARSNVHVDAPGGYVGCWDPLRMGQVVTNLLANAFKYAAGTDVDVRLQTQGERIHLTVSDNGPGIAAEHLDRVFGRFERAADSRHHGGLGLGLYVTREIVLAHNGTIRAFNRDTGGAMFEIELPRRGLES